MVSKFISSTQIFAHRGAWKPSLVAGNSEEALFGAISSGLSLETDIRDQDGKIVVTHDPERFDGSRLGLDTLLQELELSTDKASMIALNVKSDGLTPILENLLSRKVDLRERLYFFDMSTPETLRYSKASLPFAVRVSEYEPISNLTAVTWPTPPRAIWVDGFDGDWFLDDGGGFLLRFAEQQIVTVVSPELHGRDPERFVAWFSENARENRNLTVCTDLPERFLS